MEVTPEGEKKGQAKEVGATEAGEDLGNWEVKVAALSVESKRGLWLGPDRWCGALLNNVKGSWPIFVLFLFFKKKILL